MSALRHALSGADPLIHTIRATTGFVAAQHHDTLPGVRDIALDPVTGDLILVAGKARMTAPGIESITQRLQRRLRMWLGENLLDVSKGVPYQTTLGTKNTQSRPGGPQLLDQTLRECVLTAPGIASLVSWAFQLDRDRRATISFTARSIDGDPIVIQDFVAGAPA